MMTKPGATATYWQQSADYTMEVTLDVKTHRFTGSQTLVYTNNSPDTLTKTYYHLYFNAFRPNSMMDVRSRTIADADPRVSDRISKLKPDEYGELKVKWLKQNGQNVKMEHVGTILEVDLPKPIYPGESVTFTMDFEGQVPIQIRRSGRDSREGISYTMVQWYPKMAEYDVEGWHPNPYIGREFHGIWGNFDVKLTLDATYVVASSGYIQNPNDVGHGYETVKKMFTHKAGDMLTWHFKAPMVHDFSWGADPDFVHTKKQVGDVMFHFFYDPNSATVESWEKLPEYCEKMLPFMNTNFGKYPYKKYSVVQGGDGGMEYAMLTMVTGKRNVQSLVGVTVHELFHSWYQFVLATNEAKYAWMDEGFTSWGSGITMNHLFPDGRRSQLPHPNAGTVLFYPRWQQSGQEEPLTTHSDHYIRNRGYGLAAYSKGALVPVQLSYIMGDKILMDAMRTYYYTWKFKHPTDREFKRIMEKKSDLELDWFFEHFVGTVNKIDYAVDSVYADGDQTKVLLKRLEPFPMPIDLDVTLADGSKVQYYIPMRIMRGEKPNEDPKRKRVTLADWPWVNPTYEVTIDMPMSDIKSIVIDESLRLLDANRKNNAYPKPESQGN